MTLCTSVIYYIFIRIHQLVTGNGVCSILLRLHRVVFLTLLFLISMKGRRHGVDWGGHVHPTFARGRS